MKAIGTYLSLVICVSLLAASLGTVTVAAKKAAKKANGNDHPIVLAVELNCAGAPDTNATANYTISSTGNFTVSSSLTCSADGAPTATESISVPDNQFDWTGSVVVSSSTGVLNACDGGKAQNGHLSCQSDDRNHAAQLTIH